MNMYVSLFALNNLVPSSRTLPFLKRTMLLPSSLYDFSVTWFSLGKPSGWVQGGWKSKLLEFMMSR